MAEDLTTIPNPDAAGIIPVFARHPVRNTPTPIMSRNRRR
jgi:hypothetical protein